MKQYGVFESAITKNRRYWPINIPAEAICTWFENKVVGDCHRLPGEKEGLKFNIFAHKEPDYITMLMIIYGTCIERQVERKLVRSWLENNTVQMRAKFRYKEISVNHYLYRESVDAHNK